VSQPDDDKSVDALMREVDEDLRHEQFEKLWKAYGNYAIAAALALVMGVGGNEAWTSWRSAQSEKESARFAQAVALAEGGKTADAAKSFEALASEAGSSYRILSRLRAAAFLAESGDVKAARAAYEAAAADSGADKLYRDFASLQSAFLGLESEDPAQIEGRLAPLSTDDNPWRHPAREGLALLALRKGDSAKARDIYAKLADDAKAPRGLRARAAEALAALPSSAKG
jgi:hypothetical protein